MTVATRPRTTPLSRPPKHPTDARCVHPDLYTELGKPHTPRSHIGQLIWTPDLTVWAPDKTTVTSTRTRPELDADDALTLHVPARPSHRRAAFRLTMHAVAIGCPRYTSQPVNVQWGQLHDSLACDYTTVVLRDAPAVVTPGGRKTMMRARNATRCSPAAAGFIHTDPGGWEIAFRVDVDRGPITDTQWSCIGLIFSRCVVAAPRVRTNTTASLDLTPIDRSNDNSEYARLLRERFTPHDTRKRGLPIRKSSQFMLELAESGC